MEQYIPKSAVVAEIERKIHNIDYEGLSDRNIGQKQSLYHILSFLNTLEVKETDLENEFFNWYHEEKNRDYNASILYERYGIISKKLAKHFYELGLKLQKGE